MKTQAFLTLIFLSGICFGGLGSNTLALKKKLQSDGAKQLCTSSSRGEDVTDAQAAFGLFYLDWENQTANSRLKKAIEETGGNLRQIPLWLRMYCLFTNPNDLSSSKLDAGARDMLTDIFARYVEDNNKPDITTQAHRIDDFCRISNVYLALQILKNSGLSLPQLPADTIKTDLARLNEFLPEYCRARVAGGLWPAVSSDAKGADLLCCLVNLYDFAQDEPLKKRVSMLLDIIWADWAQDQMNLVRGGARMDTLMPPSSNDMIKFCAVPFLSPDMNWTDGRKYTIPDHNCIYIMATTSWRMPDVVMDMILDAGGRGDFEYQSQLPAAAELTVSGLFKRYSYCTNEYVLGGLFIDPAAAQTGLPDALNMVQGLTFADGAYASVSCEGGIVQAIGDKNILIFQHPQKTPDEPSSKISVSEGVKSLMTERGGWLVFRQSSTWAAIKGLSIRRPGAGCGYEWVSDIQFTLKEPSSPLVVITGSARTYKNIDAFVTYITEHDWRIKDAVLTYNYTNDEGKPDSFTMYLDGSAKPLAGAKPLNFSDLMLYESPFMKSVKGSGVIMLKKDNRKLMYHTDRDEIVDSK